MTTHDHVASMVLASLHGRGGRAPSGLESPWGDAMKAEIEAIEDDRDCSSLGLGLPVHRMRATNGRWA